MPVPQGSVKPPESTSLSSVLKKALISALSAAELVKAEGGNVAGFSFIASLDFLRGKDRIVPYSNNIVSAINFQ